MKKVFLLWAVSLVLVYMATSALAQPRRTPLPTVTGGDIGFRVDRTDANGQAFGALLIRYNGQWVETETSVTVRK